MPSALLERFRQEFGELRRSIEDVQNTAAAAHRDLTEQESATCAEYLQRAEGLRPRIEQLVAQEQTFAAGGEALARVTQGGTGTQLPIPGDAPRAEQLLRSMYPDPGAYALDVLLASGNTHIQRAGLGGRVVEAQGRLARAQDIMRAAQSTLLADATGILPTPIVQPVINVIDASRPVFASFTSRPMPGSKPEPTTIPPSKRVSRGSTSKTSPS